MDEKTTYGYAHNDDFFNFDPRIYQSYSNTCAIRSQQIVLRDYGMLFSQTDMIKYAEAHNWYDSDPENGGTPLGFLGDFVSDCGVPCTKTANANVYDIISELRQGHRVMVAVDSHELWVNCQKSIWKRNLQKCLNKLEDAFGGERPNHVLIVAGVDVNPKNISDIHVTLIDSGTGQVCASYPYAQFKDAWDDSKCLMVSTNVPAPYQYNYRTHEMEPSGYKSSFSPADVVLPEELDNCFRLSDYYYDTYRNIVRFSSSDIQKFFGVGIDAISIDVGSITIPDANLSCCDVCASDNNKTLSISDYPESEELCENDQYEVDINNEDGSSAECCDDICGN